MRRIATRSKAWLRGRRGATHVDLTLESPVRVVAGWLLRLEVRNQGPAGTFRAEVVGVAVTGDAESTLRPPWDLTWRHPEHTDRIRLPYRAKALLRLAYARTDRPFPDLVLLRHDTGDRSPRVCRADADHRVTVDVRLRHAETDEIVAEQRVEISFSSNAGEIEPKLTFVRGGAPLVPPTASREPADAGVALEARTLSEADKQWLTDVLRCARCGEQYSVGDTELDCRGCHMRYPVLDGIAMLTTEATVPTRLEAHDYDDISHLNDRHIATIGRQWSQIISDLGLTPHDALEIGAGSGALTLGLLGERAVDRLTATDVSPEFLRVLASKAGQYRTTLSFVVCDANEPHFRADAFDLVVGRSILHHLLDYDVTLRQCATILKPGGAAVFFEPVLEGKLFVAMLMALVLRCDEMSNDPQLLETHRRRMRRTIAHATSARGAAQDRDALVRIEDKYIFEIDELAAVGRRAGFASVEFVNNGAAGPDYWPNLEWTLEVAGIEAERVRPYRWIGEEFANTYGRTFPEKLVTPMGFFVFRK
jgi:ubiquinone/menaquinone biosynthesis C-methylase UbiE